MPILTLTTDIGQRDFLVGAIKGQFVNLLPTITICDITHQLSQTNYPQAAYICNNAFTYYPHGTFHLVIADMFASPVKYLLLAKYHNQFLICPDNGLLTMITGTKPAEMVAIKMEQQGTLLYITQQVAEAVNRVVVSNDLQTAGTAISNIVEKYPLRATLGPDWMEGQILFIDNFENVVINITREEFVERRNGRNFKIVFKRNETIDQISDNYTSVPDAEKIAWFNSAGYLEIALRNGNMAGLFGLQGFRDHTGPSNGYQDNKWFYQTVRIFFE